MASSYQEIKDFQIKLGHNNRIPLLFSHRGMGTGYFENTISSFLQSLEEGFDGIEVDVNMTKDGTLICFHDRTIKKISGHKDYIRNIKVNVMRSIPLEGNERIPVLQEVLDAIPPSVPVILDIKTEGIFDLKMIEPLSRVIRKNSYGPGHPLMIASFNYFFLKFLSTKFKDLDTGLIIKTDNLQLKVAMTKPFIKYYTTIFPHISTVDHHNIEKWKKLNLKIIPWGINEISDAQKLIEYGVWGMIIDDPKLIKSFK